MYIDTVDWVAGRASSL